MKYENERWCSYVSGVRTYFRTSVVPHKLHITELTLHYLERPPREASLAKPPLIVLLHGRAANASTIFSIEGLLDPRFHVIAIRGAYQSEKGGYEWFHPDSAVQSDEIADAERFEESEQLLTADIQEHLTRVAIDPENLFLWGFSQGAAMALILGLRGNVKPKGVVPMAGFIPSPVKKWGHWDAHAEYLFVHGTNDEVLPPQTSLDAKSFLESKGIRAEYHKYSGRHKMSLDSIAYVNDWIKRLANL